MDILKKLLNYLDGKKTTIATILGAILVFAQGRDYVAQDVAELISIVLIALGLSVNYAKAKLL